MEREMKDDNIKDITKNFNHSAEELGKFLLQIANNLI